MLSRIEFLLALLSCAWALPSSAQTLVTDITVPGNPYGVAVNPHNNRIYVSLSTSTGPAVGVIDGNTNTVIDTISIPMGSEVVAANLVTDRVYTGGCDFSQNSQCAVTVIDGTTDQVIATIPVKGTGGMGVQAITVNPATNEIYVADDMNYSVEVIDGNTNTASYINTKRTEMLGLAVDFATNQIVGAPSGGVMDIINASTDAISYVKVGTINQEVAVNSFTGVAYITDNAGSNLGVVNLVHDKLAASVPLGSAQFGVCLDYLSNLVFVSVLDGTVAVVDGKKNIVTGSVAASSTYLDVNPSTRLVYASASGGSVVHVISE